MDPVMWLLGKGLSTTKIVSAATNKFPELFQEKNIRDFDRFHEAILHIFVTVNKALPGKHWVVPSFDEIKKCYNDVQAKKNTEKQKEIVTEFMEDRIQLNKADNTLLFIGLATPPAAMAAKKAGEAVPPFKFIKHVPDVLFVPAATLLTLVAAKITRSLWFQRTEPEDRLVPRNKQAKSNSP